MAEEQKLKISNVIWNIDNGRPISINVQNGEQIDTFTIREVLEAGKKQYLVMSRTDAAGKTQVFINLIEQDEEHYIKIAEIKDHGELENAEKLLQEFDKGIRVLNIGGMATRCMLLGLFNTQDVPYVAFIIHEGKTQGSIVLFRYGITEDGHRIYNLIQKEEDYKEAERLFSEWTAERLASGKQLSDTTLEKIEKAEAKRSEKKKEVKAEQ